MTTTMTTLAVEGTTPKINETITSLRVAAMVMALPNVSSAPPLARCWPISFARGNGDGAAKRLISSPPGPLSADIIRKRRDAAWKMSS
jgi:hypothetical protein